MVGKRAYDLAYRVWAPWDAAGVREDLRRLLDSGIVSPQTHPEAIDLGCGSGANVVHLATQGYRVTGLDFSGVALTKAQQRANQAHVERQCTFVEADLTSPALPDKLGRYDLLLDFGTLDDLNADGRRTMAGNIAALARPGAVFLFWCFYGPLDELPFISFNGPSRLSPAVEPGEEQTLFGDAFNIETFGDETPRFRCFLLRRRS